MSLVATDRLDVSLLTCFALFGPFGLVGLFGLCLLFWTIVRPTWSEEGVLELVQGQRYRALLPPEIRACSAFSSARGAQGQLAER